MSQPERTCALCDTPQHDVVWMWTNATTAVCERCVEACAVDLAERRRQQHAGATFDAQTAAGLLADLAADVVAQPAASRALVAALRQHDARTTDDTALPAPRVLLVGPRGAGKTALGEWLCARCPTPALRVEVGRLAPVGAPADRVEHLAALLVLHAGRDVALAERGALFVDDLGALRARDDSEGAQHELVRLLEGPPLHLPVGGPRLLPDVPECAFRIDGLLVVAALGVDAHFAGGTLPRDEASLRRALLDAGWLPALVARFDRVVPVPALDEAALREVLVRPKGLLARARRTADAAGGELVIAADALDAIVAAAAASGEGAWALVRLLDRALEGVLSAEAAAPIVVLDAAAARGLIGAGL